MICSDPVRDWDAHCEREAEDTAVRDRAFSNTFHDYMTGFRAGAPTWIVAQGQSGATTVTWTLLDMLAEDDDAHKELIELVGKALRGEGDSREDLVQFAKRYAEAKAQLAWDAAE